jgi:hypothetical protein
MAFPCIGMLAQSSARGLREERDLSTVVNAAIKGAASLGLRWANLDGDQAVPFVDLEVVGIAKGPATSSTIYIYIYIYMYGGGVDFFWTPLSPGHVLHLVSFSIGSIPHQKRKTCCSRLTDALAKDNDLNVYLSCADGMRKFDKDGKLLFLDVDRGAQG